MRACGVEPGRRLVEEDDLRIPDEAHRDVEAAAHATRIRRHPPRGRVGQRETIEQVIRDRARVLEVPQPGDQHEVLPPAEDLVDGRELSGEADGLPHVRSLRGDIEAVDAGSPRVGLSSVDRIFTTVVLPAPFEPSRAKMLPRATSKSTPRSTSSVLVRLLQALHVDRRPLDLIRSHLDVRSLVRHGSLSATRSMALVSRSRSRLIH